MWADVETLCRVCFGRMSDNPEVSSFLFRKYRLPDVFTAIIISGSLSQLVEYLISYPSAALFQDNQSTLHGLS